MATKSKIATDMLEAKRPFNLERSEEGARDLRRGRREGAGTFP